MSNVALKDALLALYHLMSSEVTEDTKRVSIGFNYPELPKVRIIISFEHN